MRYKRTDCPYCGGVGRTGNSLAFDLNGNLIDCQPYMLNCRCNDDGKLLQMRSAEDIYNKTYAKGMYFRVFTGLDQSEIYLKKVYANGGKDILK